MRGQNVKQLKRKNLQYILTMIQKKTVLTMIQKKTVLTLIQKKTDMTDGNQRKPGAFLSLNFLKSLKDYIGNVVEICQKHL